MKDRPGHVMAVAGQRACAAALDGVLFVLVVIAGLLVWMPLVGVTAARETVGQRRTRRRTIAAIRSDHGEIWARQMRRNAVGQPQAGELLPRLEHRMTTTWRLAAGLPALVFCLTVGVVPALAETRPIVVELFTSQGCSSCPPADALLRELARRDDVLALGFHISYWDRLGWTDPLSSEASTDRQKSYARRLNGGQVYTPQIVVEGSADMVGSNRAAVLAALHDARPVAAAPVRFAADRRSVSLGSGAGNGAVLLVRFLRQQTTEVAAGENAGRILQDANGVRVLTRLGGWDGAARDFPIDPPAAGEGLAVLVQATDGKILGAAISQNPDL